MLDYEVYGYNTNLFVSGIQFLLDEGADRDLHGITRFVVGRGHASLWTNADTWHSKLC